MWQIFHKLLEKCNFLVFPRAFPGQFSILSLQNSENFGHFDSYWFKTKIMAFSQMPQIRLSFMINGHKTRVYQAIVILSIKIKKKKQSKYILDLIPWFLLTENIFEKFSDYN